MLESKCSDISNAIDIVYSNDTVRHLMARLLMLLGFAIFGMGVIVETTPSYSATNNKEADNGRS